MSKKCPVCGWSVYPKKPEVTEEWIGEWSEKMANYWEGQEDDYFVKDIKQMLKEAGVHVL